MPVDGSRDPPDTLPEDGVRHRAGEGVNEDGRTGAGSDNRVDHTKLVSWRAANVATDTVNTYTTCTKPTTPVSTHTAPRRDTNVGARDGMRAQRRGARRRHRGTQEGSSGNVEPRERPDTVKLGAQSNPGMHPHHPTTATARSMSCGHPGEDADTRILPCRHDGRRKTSSRWAHRAYR